jgi:hypothetical protein
MYSRRRFKKNILKKRRPTREIRKEPKRPKQEYLDETHRPEDVNRIRNSGGNDTI